VKRISGFDAVAGGAWLALQALAAARHAGAAIPLASLAAAAAVTAGLALYCALRTASSVWRGPPIVSLPKDDVVPCDPPEAELIRAAAQLRGTMGGAGHVHPRRLALPALAWLAAAASALAWADPLDAAPWVALVGAAATAAYLFPATAFLYREATGGRLVLHPPSARREIVRSRPLRAVVPGARGAP
jgi:hypothetical protein